MDRNFEVLVNITGEEWSVMPVSAMEYLSCVKEAEALGERLDAGKETELLRRACVLSRGIYSGGERVFDDGEGVLNALTPEEIYSISAGTTSVLAAEGRGEDKIPGLLENKHEDGVTAPYEDVDRFKSGVKYVLRRVEENTGAWLPTAGQSRAAEKAEVRYSDYEVPDGNGTREPEYRRKVRDMSDFLMRDSRRYDGGFELY